GAALRRASVWIGSMGTTARIPPTGPDAPTASWRTASWTSAANSARPATSVPSGPKRSTRRSRNRASPRSPRCGPSAAFSSAAGPSTAVGASAVPPPSGWDLPDVAAAQAELESFDLVAGLVIEHGPQGEGLNGIALPGGWPVSWPLEASVTAQQVSPRL